MESIALRRARIAGTPAAMRQRAAGWEDCAVADADGGFGEGGGYRDDDGYCDAGGYDAGGYDDATQLWMPGEAQGRSEEEQPRIVGSALEMLGGVRPHESERRGADRRVVLDKGVRDGAAGNDAEDDAEGDAGDAFEDAVLGRAEPRFIVTPGACAVIVLVLVTALCACLVLLIKQGNALARFAQGEESGYAVSSSASKRSSGSTGSTGSGASGNSDGLESSAGASGSASPSAATGGDGNTSGMPQNGSDAQASASGGQKSGVSDGAASDGTASSGAASPGSGLVNLNTATSEQLQTVKGIGPATAQKIIDYRQTHGPFTSVDDLVNVDGIGAKTVNKLRGQVTV